MLPHAAHYNREAAPGAMNRVARALGSDENPATVQLIDDISISIDPPVQTGKVLEAAYNNPFGYGRGAGFSGGGGGGGGGSPIATGLPPFPTEDVRNNGPNDDSSSMPNMIPSPSSIAVMAALSGMASMRRRR